MKLTSSTPSSLFALAAIVATAFSTPAFGGDAGSVDMALGNAVTLTDTPDSGLEFTFTGYGFLAGLEGTSAIMGVPTNLDIDFDDVIDNLGVVWAQTFEVRKGRVALFTDFMYLKLIPSFNGPGPVVRTDLEIQQTMLSIMGSYRLVETERTTIDLLGGARYMNFQLEVDLVPGPNTGGNDTWWNAIGGVRIRHYVTDRLFVNAYADVGGGASEDTWQALGLLGYHLKENISIVAGYRYLHDNYSDGGFAYNLDTSGPLLGLTINF